MSHHTVHPTAGKTSPLFFLSCEGPLQQSSKHQTTDKQQRKNTEDPEPPKRTTKNYSRKHSPRRKSLSYKTKQNKKKENKRGKQSTTHTIPKTRLRRESTKNKKAQKKRHIKKQNKIKKNIRKTSLKKREKEPDNVVVFSLSLFFAYKKKRDWKPTLRSTVIRRDCTQNVVSYVARFGWELNKRQLPFDAIISFPQIGQLCSFCCLPHCDMQSILLRTQWAHTSQLVSKKNS